MKGGLLGVLTLVIGGAIAADIVANPKGSAAGLNGLNSILKTSLNAVLGHPSSGN